MFWSVISVFIIVCSFCLAIWRYLVMSQRLSGAQNPPAFYLIQNPTLLTPHTIDMISSQLNHTGSGLSFEILKKNSKQVLVLASPRWVVSSHPEIKLLEIEDYLPSDPTAIQSIFSLRFSDPNIKVIHPNFISEIYRDLELQPDESIFVQLVTRTRLQSVLDFESNIRVAISSADPGRSAQIQLHFLELLSQKTSLIIDPKNHPSADLFSDYKNRNYLDSQSIGGSLTAAEISYFLP